MAIAACGATAPAKTTLGEQDIVALAREIHEATLTIDSHDDIPFNFATFYDEASRIPRLTVGTLYERKIFFRVRS